jgi:hypothetical protein
MTQHHAEGEGGQGLQGPHAKEHEADVRQAQCAHHIGL